MNISIIIPNFNGENLLKKNLPRVLEAAKNFTEGKVEVIIADDPSNDNSQAVISDFIKNSNEKNIAFKTISNKNKRDSGFSKNVNRATAIADGDVLILLNTDVSPHPDFLKPLISHFVDDQVFAVGCMDESNENGEIILRGRGTGSFKRGFLIHQKGKADKTDTLWVSGGSGAFRKDVWDRLGGFDELYNPFYWEDIDLSYRAQKAGYKIIFEPKSVVAHTHDEGAIKKSFGKKHIKAISYRNQFIFMWKNVTDWNLIIAHILWLPYHFIKALVRADSEFFKGFFNAIYLWSKISTHRNEAKKLFKRTDLEIVASYV